MGGAVVGTGVRDALAAGVRVPASAVPDADLVVEAEVLGEALPPGVPEAALDTLREAVEEEEAEALVEAWGLAEAARESVGRAVVGAEVGEVLAPGDCVPRPGLPDTLCVVLADARPDAVPKNVPEEAPEALAGTLPLVVGVARSLADAVCVLDAEPGGVPEAAAEAPAETLPSAEAPADAEEDEKDAMGEAEVEVEEESLAPCKRRPLR